MRAVRVPIAPAGSAPFTPKSPAPASALRPTTVPRPAPSRPGELLVQIKATTIIRDNLTWPELYTESTTRTPAQLGNDFAGVVVSTYSGDKPSPFKPGDEVYGMISAHRGGAWAEYAIVTEDEASLKPALLSWDQAAALPLSALTADQALFEHGGLENEAGGIKKRVLVTGAAGGVGTYLVQFGLGAGHEVVGATSSRERNGELLRTLGLGVNQAVQYEELGGMAKFDVVVDTVGGDVLRQCWGWVKDGGRIVSIDSASWGFVEKHRAKGYDSETALVYATFFIVEPSRTSMARISDAVDKGGLKVFVSRVMPLEEAREGYEFCQSGQAGKGRIVLVP